MHRPLAPAWRTIALHEEDPAALLRGSDALLDALAEDPTPTLRWYRPTRPVLVLGRGQRRLPVVPPPGLGVLHRASGGGAVLFDADLLSLDVALPEGHPWLDGSDLGAVFVELGRRWAAGLASIGVDEPLVHEGPSTTPRGGDRRSRLLAAVCYASVGRGEVTVGGRKLVGLAQRRRRHGAVVQCGLLRRWQPDTLVAALGEDPTDPRVRDAAIGLDDLLGHRVDDAAVTAAIEAALG